MRVLDALCALLLFTAPSFAAEVVSVHHNEIGRVSTADGDVSFITMVPHGTRVMLWSLDASGAPSVLLSTALVKNHRVDLDVVQSEVSDITTLRAEYIDAEGDAQVLATIVVEPSPLILVPTPPSASTPSSAEPVASPVTEGKGVSGYLFQCDKIGQASCRLTIVTVDGVTIPVTLNSGESAFVSAINIIYAKCDCK